MRRDERRRRHDSSDAEVRSDGSRGDVVQKKKARVETPEKEIKEEVMSDPEADFRGNSNFSPVRVDRGDGNSKEKTSKKKKSREYSSSSSSSSESESESGSSSSSSSSSESESSSDDGSD